MISPELSQRIIQFNPWLVKPKAGNVLLKKYIPIPYIHREIEGSLHNAGKAVLVIGPRQSGKSTIIWHTIKELIPNVLFLNMEDPLLRLSLNSPIDFTDLVEKEYPFIKAVFIDEIQHMEEAGLFIKGIVDTKLHFSLFVTGSSSFDLRSKTRESLAGRAHRAILYPFTLTEIIKSKGTLNKVAAKHIVEETVTEQIIHGSYPAVHLARGNERKRGLLNDLVEALILRDASDLFKIKRIDAFRKLLTLLAMQIGNIANVSELASLCHANVGTVVSHIEILEESHIVKALRPFAGGKRREITSAAKVFFIDNGIRNMLINNFSENLGIRTDGGQLFENWAFTEIQKAMPLLGSLYFWRSKSNAEVDFIIDFAGKLSGVEVKFAHPDKPKLTKSAHSFIEAYAPERFAFLNLSLDEKIIVGSTEVSFITPVTMRNWLNHVFQG
jgi:predicted AAA+ superfamily ATPase